MEQKNANWGGEKEPKTPFDDAESKSAGYQAARKEWDDRIGSAVVQSANWRRFSFFCLIILAASVLGNIYLGAQPKEVPHIVQIDGNGIPSYQGRAGKNWGQYKPDEPSIKYHLRRFIVDTRSLSFDPAVIQNNWKDAYTLLTPNAQNVLSDYVRRFKPFERAKDQRISVDIKAMLPISEKTWQIDWLETTWGPQGTRISEQTWRGSFSIEMWKPSTAAQLAANPIGLFIDSFDWSTVEN